MKQFILLVSIIILINSCIVPVNNNSTNQIVKEEPYALYEDFVSNKLGWIEEKTYQHELEIKNGYYFIHSKDTSFIYTSTSPLDKSFLYGLKNFELESHLQLVKQSPKETQFGVFFISGTLQYDFILDFEGICKVFEYNHANQTERTLSEKELSSFNKKSINSFKIRIHDKKFSFLIDNELAGTGDIASGSWQEMRLFASSGTDLMLHSFTILKQ